MKKLFVLIKHTIKNILICNKNNLNLQKKSILLIISVLFLVSTESCNYITHRTLSNGAVLDSTSEDPEPNYNISLDRNYQDFVSYLYIGNRIENFTSYFNTFFKATEDYNEAFEEYRTTTIGAFNRSLDSMGVSAPLPGTAKEKLNKSIERSSKIIQFHKNSRYIDRAVLLIGKSYYFLGDYINSERKFNEFLSKLSSSENADEAILFLGRSKIKLGKKEEGENLIKNLLKDSQDKEIKSLAARDLGIIEYAKRNIDEAINYFKSSIEYSGENERKAEGQFILAKILSSFKPEHAASEFKKVSDFTSDFDLGFYAKLNYAKGLIYNREYRQAEEVLNGLRKKYREVPEYSQLSDLELANTYYGKKNLKQARDKYFEVIVKYQGSPASADAYYYLGKHEEEVNKDYLKALSNYRKAVSENGLGEFHTESQNKSMTLERYFALYSEINDSVKIEIPAVNKELEQYRKIYNEEKGLEVPIENTENNGQNNQHNNKGDDGSQTGHGKGKPGGIRTGFRGEVSDTLKETEDQTSGPKNNPGRGPGNMKNEDIPKENLNADEKDTSVVIKNDSLIAVNKTEKIFNAYFELAELFTYNLHNQDSAEFYLKHLLEKYPESGYQSKVMYALGNLYKNGNKKNEAEETFRKLVSIYPNTIYGYEAKKILGMQTVISDQIQKPIDEIFSKAFELYNQKKYPEAIEKLYEVKNNFPDDTIIAKSYYGIGYIYENGLNNKDSSLHYYKMLKEKFPESEYTRRVTPILDYIASLEVKDTTKNNDSLKSIVSDSTGIKQEIKESEKDKEKVEQEIKPDAPEFKDEKQLSPEEMEKIMKETDEKESPK